MMPIPSPIPGVKCLIFGKAGRGKTYSTRTLFDITGLQPVHVFLEPSQSTISDIPEAQWAHVSPYGDETNSNTIIEMFSRINTMSNEDLQKSGGMTTKRDMHQILDFLNLLNNFKTTKGQTYGDVATWGTDKILVIDGLTDLTRMARHNQSGLKPLLTQPDYGAIMYSIETLLKYLTEQLWCHLVLIAHVEQERDEVGGGYLKSISTIGRKLAPIIPPMFDDVIMAYEQGGKFLWSTMESDADTKNRTMPLSQTLDQDFAILFDAWKAKGGVFSSGRPGAEMAGADGA